MTNLGGLCLELLSGKGLESAFLEGIGLGSSPLQFRRKPPGRRRGQGRRKTRCGLKLVVS